jgi:hypothetical protein
MAELAYTIEPADGLEAATTGAMFALYSRYYDAASEDRFRRDLAEKDYVIVLRDADGGLQGFSTAMVGDHDFRGQRLRSFYSGDTIVDEAYWGQQALPTAWFQLTGHIKAAEPETPLYWFLLVKGHRTYRYLHAFFKVFFPTHERATPPADRALMDMLAAEKFGDDYDRCHGVIRFPESHGHLKATWAEIPDKDRQRPEVRFFLERNPGYVNGDELVCLTELVPENLKPLAERLFRKGMDTGI